MAVPVRLVMLLLLPNMMMTKLLCGGCLIWGIWQHI